MGADGGRKRGSARTFWLWQSTGIRHNEGMIRTTFARFVLLLLAGEIASQAASVDWPEFRGPTGDGHVANAKGLPLEWSETKIVKWKTEIPLHGISTPVVMDGQVWLTTAAKD